MTISRSQQICLEQTAYYHCTARCVRRAFLCGKDRYSGKNFGHRRQWLENRFAFLAGVFAIDLLAYAIMENHYHTVVRINAEAAVNWSKDEVRSRWAKLYPRSAETLSPPIQLWRERLMSLSWFMRCVNEPLARYANKEDDCKGRFWEGRFKSQALLDNSAILKCMCYVDLNPVRAAIADTPEASHYTSIKARLEGRDGHLVPFETKNSIPIDWRNYLELVDWTGRAIRNNKRGSISANLPPIISRTGLEPDSWVTEMRHYGHWYYRAVGSAQALQSYCEHLGQKWLKTSPRLESLPV